MNKNVNIIINNDGEEKPMGCLEFGISVFILFVAAIIFGFIGWKENRTGTEVYGPLFDRQYCKETIIGVSVVVLIDCKYTIFPIKIWIHLKK